MINLDIVHFSEGTMSRNGERRESGEEEETVAVLQTRTERDAHRSVRI